MSLWQRKQTCICSSPKFPILGACGQLNSGLQDVHILTLALLALRAQVTKATLQVYAAKALKTGSQRDYLGGPSVMTRVLARGRQEVTKGRRRQAMVGVTYVTGGGEVHQP